MLRAIKLISNISLKNINLALFKNNDYW